MIQLLSLLFGLSFLSGLNLYLTTFLASLAVREEWFGAGLHPAVAGLGHPAVMLVALGMFLVEFVTDKIPWVDSLWDAVHTLIRPVGAAALSVAMLQESGLSGPVIGLVAVVAAGVALSTHLTKSGIRLLVNASPEPITNILASVIEDAVVVLLVALLVQAPVTGFAACLTLFALTWLALPRLFRLVKASLFLLWRKFFQPASAGAGGAMHRGGLPTALTVDQELQVCGVAGPEAARAAWALACVSGKVMGIPGLRANRFGTLVSPELQPGSLIFLQRGWFRRKAFRISLAGVSVRQESGFLSENLVIHRTEDGLRLVCRFTRAEAALVARLVVDLQARLGHAVPGLEAGAGLVPPALPEGAGDFGRLGEVRAAGRSMTSN